MMLVEEGKLDLAAPVHPVSARVQGHEGRLSRFRDPASGQSKLRRLEPQKRPMTVEDLLRHTSGLFYFDHGNTAVHKLYARAGCRQRLGTRRHVEGVRVPLAQLPLAHQPGEVFEYGHSADVLDGSSRSPQVSRSISFVDNRLFKPLGWSTPVFWVRRRSFARLIDPPAGARVLPDRDVTKPTTLFSGGGGWM